MGLKVVADSFLALMLVALGINLALLLVVRQAGDTTAQAVARRDAAHAQVDQLVHETDLLSHLVQSCATTGRVGYLEIYYDILAVRQGDKPAPRANARPAWATGRSATRCRDRASPRSARSATRSTPPASR